MLQVNFIYHRGARIKHDLSSERMLFINIVHLEIVQ